MAFEQEHGLTATSSAVPAPPGTRHLSTSPLIHRVSPHATPPMVTWSFLPISLPDVVTALNPVPRTMIGTPPALGACEGSTAATLMAGSLALRYSSLVSKSTSSPSSSSPEPKSNSPKGSTASKVASWDSTSAPTAPPSASSRPSPSPKAAKAVSSPTLTLAARSSLPLVVWWWVRSDFLCAISFSTP